LITNAIIYYNARNTAEAFVVLEQMRVVTENARCINMKQEHCGLKYVFEETGYEGTRLDSYESQVIPSGICGKKAW
jgi:hypothetical protein